MTHATTHSSDLLTPTTTIDSSASTSSGPSKRSSSSSSSRSHTKMTLPPPPPADRMPPPKGRSTQPSQKFRLGRKDKHERKKSMPALPTNPRKDSLDDDWTIEGGPSRRNSQLPPAQQEQGVMEVLRPPEDTMFDSQMTEVPTQRDVSRDKEKKSKSRGLAKKTSQLFSRSSSKDKGAEGDHGGSSASLRLPNSSRQTSYSSAGSIDSASSTSSSFRHPMAGLHRPPSNQSQDRSPKSNHSRRLSQDSGTSWTGQPRSIRSGSSSAFTSPTESNHLPIPSRQNSQLSASVPSLSRQGLPQPAPGQDAGGNFPSRMSTWFSHLIPSASTASVPAPAPQLSSSASPRKPTSAAASFLNAARQRAVDGVRHLLDSEAQPDKCPDPMWVMGVAHPGWRPDTPIDLNGSPSSSIARSGNDNVSESDPPLRSGEPDPSDTVRPKRKDNLPISPPAKGFGNLFSASTLSLALPASITQGSPSKDTENRSASPMESPSKQRRGKEKEVLKWPENFYDDFRSIVWCTYRSQYAPIVSLPPHLLLPSPEAYFGAFKSSSDPTSNLPLPRPGVTGQVPAARMSSSPWGWRAGEERGLTSDSGWGCMLRTGQSMLANAIIHLHLGRGWRLPTEKPSTSPSTPEELAVVEAYAKYVKILTWFLDDPSPLCPFSVHRMALIGKELGKEVGEWFGPSTAAGALKTLGNSFGLSGLAVATAVDSIVYKSDVLAASNLPSGAWDQAASSSTSSRRGSATSGRSGMAAQKQVWGDQAVLILIGIRLGLDGVNPIYYDSVKTIFTFPQSVGIAGGRPSSSYYFVASQANSLYYLDPHLTRPAIPLEVPPAPTQPQASDKSRSSGEPQERASPAATYALDVVHVDEAEETSGSDTDQPSHTERDTPLRTKLSGENTPSKGQPSTTETPRKVHVSAPSLDDPFGGDALGGSIPKLGKPIKSDTPAKQSSIQVDPQTAWYVDAYPESAMRTFHCDKVKKMPLSGLDPSMLLGFLVRDQAEFDDFCDRVKRLPQKIFTVQNEQVLWDDDDETGLESVSEPDMDDLADELDATVIETDVDEFGTHTVQAPDAKLEDRDTVTLKSTRAQRPLATPPVDAEMEDDEWENTKYERERESTPSSLPITITRDDNERGPQKERRPGPVPVSGGFTSESWVQTGDYVPKSVGNGERERLSPRSE